jgi:hypothetical protein
MPRRLRRNLLLCGVAAVVVMASSRHHHAGVRCLAAFASSQHSTKKQRLPFSASCYGNIAGRSTNQHPYNRRWFLLQRGGSSSSVDNSNRVYGSTRPIETVTPIQDADSSRGESNKSAAAAAAASPSSFLYEKANESMPIAGKSSSLKSFGGLTYRDALSEKERFRVLFVLGGPGAYDDCSMLLFDD